MLKSGSHRITVKYRIIIQHYRGSEAQRLLVRDILSIRTALGENGLGRVRR